jgi:hypothetical protein
MLSVIYAEFSFMLSVIYADSARLKPFLLSVVVILNDVYADCHNAEWCGALKTNNIIAVYKTHSSSFSMPLC